MNTDEHGSANKNAFFLVFWLDLKQPQATTD